MFHQISWQGYWTFLALLSTFYYIILGLLYYRQDLLAWMGRSSTKSNDNPSRTPFSPHKIAAVHLQAGASETVPSALDKMPSTDAEESIFDACLDELDAFFREAKSRKWNRAELLFSVQGILFKYPSLKTSIYKESLEPVILAQCEQSCSIRLTADDLVGLW